jgi:hypothetical protein
MRLPIKKTGVYNIPKKGIFDRQSRGKQKTGCDFQEQNGK